MTIRPVHKERLTKWERKADAPKSKQHADGRRLGARWPWQEMVLYIHEEMAEGKQNSLEPIRKER